MDSFFVIADTAARSRLADIAFSALPDAPVQPVEVRRHRVRRLIVALRSLPRRPQVAMPARRAARTECANTA